MSSKVVNLADWKAKSESTEQPTRERVDADQFFADIQRRNEENKKREEKERSKNNAGTIRSYKLKEE